MTICLKSPLLAATVLAGLAACAGAGGAGGSAGSGGAAAGAGGTGDAGGSGGTGLDCPHPPGDAQIAPDAWFSKELDLGPVMIGESVTGKVSIVNGGTTPVSVHESNADLTPFTTDLACTGPCESRQLPVAGQMDIGFTFHPTAAPEARQVAEFQTSCGAIRVDLQGQGVAPAFSCTPGPGSTIDFGEMVQGTSLTRAITCTNLAGLDAVLRVEPVQDDTGQVSLSYPGPDGRVLVAAGRSVDLGVTVAARLLPADVDSSDLLAGIHLDYEDGSPFASFAAKAVVLAAALQVDPNPSPYDFGCVALNATGHVPITLRNRGRDPLTITMLTFDPSSYVGFGFTAPGATPFAVPGFDESNPGVNEVGMDLTFTPVDPGEHHGILVLKSDDAAQRIRFLDLTGLGGACH